MRNFIVTCVFFMVTIMIGCGAPLDITKEKNTETVLWGNLEVVDSDCDSVFAQTLEEACRAQKQEVSFSDCMTNIIHKCAVNPENLSEGFYKDCFDAVVVKGPRSKIYFGDCDDTDSTVGMTGSETRSCVEGLEIGTETRTCSMGVWEDWSDVTCVFCTDGESENSECGLNGRGSMTRICVEDAWSEYSECVDSDVCVDDATSTIACGINGRGTQVDTCVSGAWVTGICEDSDVCVDDATSTIACGINGRGTQVDTCVSGAWVTGICEDSDVCVDDATSTIACGINGRGTQVDTCVTGTMVDGTCEDDDTCVDDTTETIACGINGRGTQVNTCVTGTMVDGTCEDDDSCLDGDTRNLTCGINGRGIQVETCVAGVWEGTCEDDDTCVDDTTETIACGINGRGTQVNTCVTGTMVDGTCEDDDTCVDGETQELVCGLNNRGTQTQLCVAGSYSDPSECVDPDTCVDGNTTKTDDGDYVSCQEGSWGLISCAVEDNCWTYATEFGFVETMFDTGLTCSTDSDCTNSFCEEGKCVRIFDHFNGKNFGCLPSGVCGTCDDADADGICGGGSTGPETCETNADCLSGQVCTPQGVCINYPDPSVSCFPFRMVLPADTSTTFIYVWNQAGTLVGGAPQALPAAVEGSIVIDSTSYEGACAITLEYPGRWQSYLDETFPLGAPTGNCFYSFYESSPLRILNGNAAIGCAQDALSLP